MIARRLGALVLFGLLFAAGMLIVPKGGARGESVGLGRTVTTVIVKPPSPNCPAFACDPETVTVVTTVDTPKPASTTKPTSKGRRAPFAGVWRNNATGLVSVFWFDGRSGYFARAHDTVETPDGCVLPAGEQVLLLAPLKNKLWRLTSLSLLSGFPKCKFGWAAPWTVRISLGNGGTRMNISCDKKPNKVCYRLTKVGD